jgi:hypothetical protein
LEKSGQLFFRSHNETLSGSQDCARIVFDCRALKMIYRAQINESCTLYESELALLRGNSRYCLIDALAKHIRERLKSRMSCTVFENSLARVWPVGLAADQKREERIHAFAKSNGWYATIHDLGTRVVFKKLAA